MRTVIQEVVADIDGEASEFVLFDHWIGGAIPTGACRRLGGDSATALPATSSPPSDNWC
ncbi:hypothetical protein [Mesorhizobium sp. M5C.F.Ca.IN.020.32.2.1]|uniref:hypothetical protein n=1 Tax=Mesorhizobium sp. M5C.F.Ca.IN.020.32.2.1 TaxID=2496771 RepID=UPI0019D4415B|nr:hypothetical protein [Mesorhizobium sp. M5C.F.Ca.IN.020.32.2.1]